MKGYQTINKYSDDMDKWHQLFSWLTKFNN